MWLPPCFVMVAALVVLAVLPPLHVPALARASHQEVQPDRDLPVSVVVCGRNESVTLQQLIPILMDQDHRHFEVVVVNDRSEDDTWEVLQWMKPQYPQAAPGEHPGR
jgi:cellulose synthase/poly-beta-1,6-N-acetylglucosamine synthase-like glycosyltransferase